MVQQQQQPATGPTYQQSQTTGRYGATGTQSTFGGGSGGGIQQRGGFQQGQQGGFQQGGQQPGVRQQGGFQQGQQGGFQHGGQQPGVQQQGGSGQGGIQGTVGAGTAGMPTQFEDAMTSEMRQALEDFSKVDKACEWALDRSLGQGIPQVARILADVADLAEVNEKLLARSSTVGPYAAEAFVKAATEAIQDLQGYDQPHVVAVTKVIGRGVDSVQKLLTSIGWTDGQTGQQFGQPSTYY